jgi:hypothetical protein
MSIKNKLNDPNLNEEDADQIIGAFVRRHENERLRKQYARQLKDEYSVSRSTPVVSQPVKRSRVSSMWLLSVAAAVILMVFVWAPWRETFTPEELLARHLDPAAVVLPTTRSGTPAPGSEEQSRQTFLDNYSLEGYQDALMAARGLDAPTTTDSFFMALAYLGMEQSDIALDFFTKLESSQSVYHEEITWYTALLNWKLGDLDAGIHQLRSYRVGDAYYSDAREFLRATEE